jgi:hypothetical protein
MSWLTDLRPSRFLTRRLGWALLKGFLAGLFLGMLLSGLRAIGLADARRFLAEHAGLFLVWRLLLYGVIVWGWVRVRRRLWPEASASAPEAQERWRRMEIAVLATFVLLEAGQWLQQV